MTTALKIKRFDLSGFPSVLLLHTLFFFFYHGPVSLSTTWAPSPWVAELEEKAVGGVAGDWRCWLEVECAALGGRGSPLTHVLLT